MENKNKQEGLGVAGFILSFFLPLIGLILSIMGVSKAKKNETNKGLSVAGIIISAIRLVFRGMIVAILLLVTFFVYVDEAGSEGHSNTSNVCSRAYKCSKIAGNMYECKYYDGYNEKNVYCFDNALSKEQIIKAEDNNEKKYNATDLKDIENLVSKHYMKYYDGLIDHTNSKILDNQMIEVTIYHSDDETKSSFVYTINRETLIGKDANDKYVDLNEFSDNIDDFKEIN